MILVISAGVSEHRHLILKSYVLQYNSRYFYELSSGNVARQFHFKTPPDVGPDAPYTFGVIG